MNTEIEFLKGHIDHYISARNEFLKAALRGGFSADKSDKKNEATARDAFLSAKASIYSAAEFEFGGCRASEVIDHLEEQGILA